MKKKVDPRLFWKTVSVDFIRKEFSEPEAMEIVADVMIHPNAGQEWGKMLTGIFGQWSLKERKTPYLMPFQTPVTDVVEKALSILKNIEGEVSKA